MQFLCCSILICFWSFGRVVKTQNEEIVHCTSDRWGELCPNDCVLENLNQNVVLNSLERLEQLQEDLAEANEQYESMREQISSYDDLKINLTDAIQNRLENINQAMDDTLEVIELLETDSDRTRMIADEVGEDLTDLVTQLTDIQVNLTEWYERCGIAEETVLRQNCNLPVVTGRDCADIHNKGGRESGVYLIKPDISPSPIRVYCDMDDAGGGWTVIQRRFDGTLDFSRSWHEYKHGFGQWGCDFVDEYWLGNLYIHALTAQDKQQLKVDLVSWQNESRYAWYSYFKLGDEASRYKLRYIENYRRHPVQDIGDAFRGHAVSDVHDKEQTDHKSMRFTTKDNDNDNYAANCAAGESGGWWFNRCSAANLNAKYYEGGTYTPEQSSTGYYDDGILWATWKGRWETMKETSMKIRPLGFVMDTSQSRRQSD